MSNISSYSLSGFHFLIHFLYEEPYLFLMLFIKVTEGICLLQQILLHGIFCWKIEIEVELLKFLVTVLLHFLKRRTRFLFLIFSLYLKGL